MALSLAACAPVVTVGKRVDAGGDVDVGKMQVYSFAPLHAMGSSRLHRDARRVDDALAERLAAENTDTIVADVGELVRQHGLPVETTVADRMGRRRSTTFPERALLDAQRPSELTAGVTHRLVIMPVRLNVDTGTGVAHGVLRWRVESVENAAPLAVGLMRYTADARGYPSRRMATLLVAKLRSLGIR